MAIDETVNILIVDDLPEKILVLETVLEGLGQNVVTAHSGREALRHLLEHDFAVILLDINMPDMDGFETAAMIRSRKQTAQTPIIFITAFSDEMHTAQGYSLGAVDYILSPVVPEILRTKVGVFVDLYKKTQQVKQQAEERVALARAEAARAVAEQATLRSAFLAEASTVLGRSLDYETIPRALARQAVPFLGDLCAVTLIGEGDDWRTDLAAADPDDAGGCLQESVAGLRAIPSLADAIRRVLDDCRPAILESIPEAEPGGLPWFDPRSAIVMPLHARGRTLGTLAIARRDGGRPLGTDDITLTEDLANRAAIAIDNARLYHDVQENDRRKNEFLAMLAHELRNPLAPIRNAVEVLRRLGLKDADLQWANDVIARQVEQMVRLVDDLLDVSRITGGKIRLRKEPTDVVAIVQRAVETSRPLIESRSHELTVTLPREPLRVVADLVRLAQVVANLLNNAAKYTGEGGKISLEVAREGESAVFRVRDNGIGIPAEMLSSVFDLFTQADRSLDRSQGGLGIGLTLVRRLVELHDGTVQAFSEGANRGSEFVFRLPALAGDPANARARDGGDPLGLAPIGPRRILIVDDHPDVAMTLSRLLRMNGHEVRIAHEGPAALAEIVENRPEFVLLDIGLPGMNGYEVARSIRQLPESDAIVLIALTGYGQDDDRRRSREAGFDHHLVKPVDPDALAALLAAEPRRNGSPHGGVAARIA